MASGTERCISQTQVSVQSKRSVRRDWRGRRREKGRSGQWKDVVVKQPAAHVFLSHPNATHQPFFHRPSWHSFLEDTTPINIHSVIIMAKSVSHQFLTSCAEI